LVTLVVNQHTNHEAEEHKAIELHL